MQTLEERILKDGKCLGDDILKVDSFLNHQIDVALVAAMGDEFARLFGECGVNKILTIEASGLPLAYAAARALGNLPMVFAKKKAPSTMVGDSYSYPVKSFTKGTVSDVRIAKEYLNAGDKVLIIDDFLAYGEAATGLAELCKQAGAELAGVGIAIEKQYQGGSARLRAMGIRVESLAVIASLKGGNIEFA